MALDAINLVCNVCHMKAVLAFHDKQVLLDGAIVEMEILHVATPVLGSAHKLKYRLHYGLGGQRHYVFTTVERLIADFLADVRDLRDER